MSVWRDNSVPARFRVCFHRHSHKLFPSKCHWNFMKFQCLGEKRNGSQRFHEISMSGWEMERIATFLNYDLLIASRSQSCRRCSSTKLSSKPRVETGAWMSRWKLGSMVSKWVISPIYPIYQEVKQPIDPITIDPNFPGHPKRFIHLKRMAPWIPAYALWWWQMILGMRMLG